MAVKTIEELKSLWINDYVPDEDDYIDLFDTMESFSNTDNDPIIYTYRVGNDQTSNHYHIALLKLSNIKELVIDQNLNSVITTDAKDGHTHDIIISYDKDSNTFVVDGITNQETHTHEAHIVGIPKTSDDVKNALEFNSILEATSELGINKYFRWSEKNLDGVTSPNGSQFGITR